MRTGVRVSAAAPAPSGALSAITSVARLASTSCKTHIRVFDVDRIISKIIELPLDSLYPIRYRVAPRYIFIDITHTSRIFGGMSAKEISRCFDGRGFDAGSHGSTRPGHGQPQLGQQHLQPRPDRAGHDHGLT